MKPSVKIFSCALLLICMFWLAIFPVRARAGSNDFTQEELGYIKENPVVITAIDPLFIPFEFIDIDGNYKGIAADYLKLIEIKTGLTFEILPDLTWPEAYNLALAGKVDLLPCVGATKERQENFLLTKSYLKYQRAVFSLVEGESYKFNDLDKITVGVQRNSSNYSFLVFEKKLNPVLYENNDSLLTALSEGEIEAAVANYSSAKYKIRQLGLNNIKVGEIQNSDTPELAMAVKKDNPVLQSILNKALAQISEEEKILISNKWLGIETEADYSDIYRYIILGFIVVAGTITVFVLWNRSLKKLIEERKEAESRLKLLLESVGEGIIGIDTEGKVNFTNTKSLDLLKYNDGELLGQPAHPIIHHTHPDLTRYDLSECPIQKTYTRGETHYVYDEVLWRSDGSAFDAEYTSVPLIRDDKIEGAVIVFKDITERKRQQEETKKALEQVEKL